MATKFHPEYFYGVLHDLLSGNNVNYPNKLNYSTSRIEFYSGSQPGSVADAADSLGAVLLGSKNFSTASFGLPAGGVSRLLSPHAFTPSVSGTAAWARINAAYYSSSTHPIIDTDVSITGGAGGAIIDDLNFVSGEVSTLEKLAFYLPENMGTIGLSLALRNGILNGFINGVQTDADIKIGESSTLSIYTGSLPASVYDSMAGTKLADFVSANYNTEMWSGSSSSGESALSTENNWHIATTVGAGTPGCFRLVRGDLVMQGTCSTGGADISVDKSSVAIGDTLTISEGTLLVP